MLESYSFNGGELFLVGGTQDDYENENTAKGFTDNGVGFDNKGVTKKDALKEAAENQVFAEPLYYKSADIMLKVNNYIPPMK